MSAPVGSALRRALVGRRFFGVTELEGLVAPEADPDQLERVFELLEDQAVILINEVRQRPVGHAPRWRPEFWPAVRDELAGVASTTRDREIDALHAAVLGLTAEEDDEPEVAVEDPEEPLEDPGEAYLRAARDERRLPPDEEEALAARAAAGDAPARDRLVRSFLGRVVFLARRYRKVGAIEDDLVQAGNIGLLEAIASFRPGGTRRFSSHADHRIRRAFGRHLAQERRTIRLPRGVERDLRRLLRVHEKIARREARVPTRADLAEALRVDEDEVAYLMSFLQAPLSLEGPTAPGEGLALGETIADPGAASPAAISARVSALELMDEALAELGAGHRRVVALRFGLLDGVRHPAEEVSRQTGFPPEEVSRLEREALAALQGSDELRRFAES